MLVIFTKNESDNSTCSPVQAQVIQQIARSVLNAYAIE